MTLLQQEIWKDIVGYEGLYKVSNMGNIKSTNHKTHKEDIILKPQKVNKIYRHVALCKEGKKKIVKIHILVAKAFL